jgi:hypothetical protein
MYENIYLFKHNINIYMCAYMNICIKNILLCFLILYNIIFIPATYMDGGGS